MLEGNKGHHVFLITFVFGILSCTPNFFLLKVADIFNNNRKIDFQGHRGCRGTMPENTLPGFLRALDIGVQTLEMDVVITKDNLVICSHEPWFSHEISQKKDGSEILESEEKSHKIYGMTFRETQSYDVGLKEHPRFPDQEKMPITKPLLSEVILEADKYAKLTNRPLPYYNIETKSLPETDNIYHPTPEIFCDLLLEVIFDNNVSERCIIQSFDVRTLQYIHKEHPEIKLALLIENKLSAEENLNILGFTPDIYSPEFVLVTDNLVAFCHERNIKLIPWTVNESSTMKKLISMGVDGLISDFPEKFNDL